MMPKKVHNSEIVKNKRYKLFIVKIEFTLSYSEENSRREAEIVGSILYLIDNPAINPNIWHLPKSQIKGRRITETIIRKSQ